MNRYLVCLILLVNFFYKVSAQAPAGINFQAVVRNEAGNPVANQQMTIAVKLKNAADAVNALYSENHSISTNALGQLNLVIGTGTNQVGNLSELPWGDGTLFFEAHATLPDSKVLALGVHKLNSVPFSFYANTAKTLSGPNDTDTQNELIDDVSLNNSVLKIIEAGVEHSVDLSALQNEDGDSSPTNEIQQLAIEGTTLSLSNSETTIDLSGLKDDADADPTNEIQGLTLAGPVLNISGNDTPINLAPYYGANTDEQTLDLSGTTLSILGGNSVELESLANDADADPTNEIQGLTISGTILNITGAETPVNFGDLGIGNQNLTFDGTTLSISEGNSIDLVTLGDDADASPTNEIQGLTVSGTTLNITGTNTPINLSALSIENQSLNFTGTTLSVSEGNSVNLQSLKDDGDANPTNELQSLTVSGSILNITGANSPVNLSDFSVDDQELSLSGTTLTISEGNSVDLASLKDDADASPTNEIQGLTLTNNILNISGTNTPINLAAFEGENTDEQELSLNGTSLAISGGNSVDLASLVDDADASPTNEIQGLTLTGSTLNITGNNTPINLAQFLGLNTDAQALNFNGTTLGISNGNSVDLSGLEDDADASPTNEIQGLIVTGSTLNITGANTPVDLSAFSVDDQNLLFQGTTLSISEGNAVDLASLGNDADADPSNEIQGLSFSNNILNITGNTTPIDLASLQGTANLQGAYDGGATVQLTEGSDLRINTNVGAPLLTLNNSNARVGIGTSNPLNSLEVVSSAPNISPSLRLANSDGTHAMTLFAGRTGDSNPFLSVHPTDPLRIAHYDGVSFTERLRIAPNGNLGLGTVNPGHKMHIVATTSPTTQPEFVGYEAGMIIETAETNASSLLNIGVGSILRGAGQTNYALLGTCQSTALANRGVFGYARGGSNDNIGVYGTALGASSENMGIRGLSGGATTNYGVLGRTTFTGINNYGGHFQAEFGSAANYGVRAMATGVGTNNYGVYASATGGTNNYAGYFVGNVTLPSGNLSLQTGGLSVTTGNITLQSGHIVTQNGNINIVTGILQKNFAQLIDLRHNGIYSGSGAGSANTGSAFRTIAIGQNSLQVQTTGADNVCVGWSNLSLVPNATWNTAIGSLVMSAATGTTTGNTGIGAEAMQNITGADFNTAVGFRSMDDFSTGDYNVAIGYNAMNSSGGGNGNIAVGPSSLSTVSTGSYNIAIGDGAGSNITTNENNIAIGRWSNVAPGVSDAVAIGTSAVAALSNTIILGNQNIKVGIGTNSPAEKLHVVGNVLVSGELTATTLTQSDKRLKTQITNLVSPLDVLQKIKGVSYYWISKDDKSKQYGVIAQEIEKVLPDIVKTNDAGFKAVNYTALIPFLVEAIKEQQKQIDELKKENSNLSAKIQTELAALSAKLNTLISAQVDQQKHETEKK